MGNVRDFAEKMLATAATATAFVLSAGVSTTTLPAASGQAVRLGDGFRGGIFRVVAAGANNATVTIKVWRKKVVLNPSYGRNNGDQYANTPTFDRMLVCTIVATISTSLAASSGIFGSGYFYADSLVVTIDPAFQNLIDTIGGGKTTVQAYNNASGDTEPSQLVICDGFDAEAFEFEFDCDAGGGAAVTGANVQGELTR